ncbi:MAG: rhomboid family intramembrane serine protease [Gemmatales bacterium]|nr:rhomboid family intramembrane serine protease [Gemmatales bacterium]MCS7160753.1 rhomboid family intramembrane serine protease [Gemmatales bacterium]MDW8175954.1 rhomboid family intramembrane serine protease [Gemmatales bacterium]MDW8222848.1 rhomboid family intramembrane serine protease [Gemmatales bacterium]
MGVYDRDYYREQPPGGYWFDGQSATPWLAMAHVAVYMLQLLTAGPVGHGRLTEFLMLHVERVCAGEIWRILTAVFIHDTHNWLNLVWNVLVLWFFGRQLEELYGSRRFVTLYLLAGMSGNLVWVLSHWLWDGRVQPVLFGAAPAVTFVLILCALHYPRQTVLLFFVLPVPLWLIAVLYVAKDLLVFLRPVGGMGHATLAPVHLAGAGFALAYYLAPSWRINLAEWRARRLQSQRPRPDRRPPLPVDEHLEAQADAILDKLARQGRDALSPEEWDILHRASEAYRRRR